MAAAVYLVLVAGAFLYLAVLKRSVQKLDIQISQTQPQVAATENQQQKWRALEPAIEPTRYAVEIMNLLFMNRPNADVKFTLLETGPAQWKVEGEAPNAGVAIDFVEKLKKEPGLKGFKVDAPPTKILPNESAQFVIYGKP